MFSGDVEAVEVFEVTCVLIHGEGNTLKMLITKTRHLSKPPLCLSLKIYYIHFEITGDPLSAV